MVEEAISGILVWFVDAVAGHWVMVAIAFILGGASDRWFMKRRLEQLVDKKIADRLQSTNEAQAPVPPPSKPLTKGERFGALSGLIRRNLDEVAAHLDAFTDKGQEGRYTDSDFYLRQRVYRGLRTRLRSLCEEELFPLGIEGHPQLPGPRYPTPRLGEWRKYLEDLYKFSVHGKLQEAIKFAHDGYSTKPPDGG